MYSSVVHVNLVQRELSEVAFTVESGVTSGIFTVDQNPLQSVRMLQVNFVTSEKYGRKVRSLS